MSTPVAEHHCPSCGRPTSLTAYAPEPELCVECQRALGVDPQGPRAQTPTWGVLLAVAIFVASVLAIEVAGLTTLQIYAVYAGWQGLPVPLQEHEILASPVAVALVLSTGVAHLVTFALGWAVVTDGGRVPFFKAVGWTWGRGITLGNTILISLGLQVLTIVIGTLIQAPDSTPFSRIIASSQAAKIAVGALAVLSAPIVEELVYRGVLYPAFEHAWGRHAAVILVSSAFLFVHIVQYGGALAVMLPLAALSVTLTVLRAHTGSLLPCVVLHVLFNAVQVAILFAVPDR